MNGRTHLRSFALLLLLTVLSFVLQGCSTPEERIDKQTAQAQALMDADQPDAAVALLEELRAEWPENPDIVEFLAFAHARNNNPSASADAFVAASRLDPSRSELLLYAAQAREQTGELAQAAEHYRLYITEHFDDSSAWRTLAQLESRRGNHQDAIDAFLNVYRIDPSGDTAVALGNLFLETQNTIQAYHWFDTARGKHQKEAGAGALLGLLQIAMEEENWERAEELTRLLDTEHEGELDASELSMVRGELERWKEEITERKRIEEEQIALAERLEAERKKRAEEEERLALEEAKAREEAEKAKRLAEEAESNPPVPEEIEEIIEEPIRDPYQELLAEAANFEKNGRFGSAARTYWRALSYDDSDALVWFDLSHALYRAETWNDAELTALEALRRDPDNERYHLHYLNVIRRTHPVRSYLRELERVHEKFPRNPQVVLALAETYAHSQHSHPIAVRYYQLFLRLAPEDSRRAEVEQAIRKLSQL